MEIVDANVILRYLLKDHKSHFVQSKEIIEKRELFIPMEVLAEVVYVLEKIYEVPAVKITDALTEMHLQNFWHMKTLELQINRSVMSQCAFISLSK